MPTSSFDDMDVAQLRAKGISIEEVQRQLFQYQKTTHHLELDRPCTVGDGVERIEAGEAGDLIALHDAAQAEGRCQKFVPASGAASRMFRDLLPFHLADPARRASWADVVRRAKEGDAGCGAVRRLLQSIDRFPFRSDLERALGSRGMDLSALAAAGSYPEILEALLSADGLGYADLPKGLLSFHRHGDGVRTPFDEHLVEASGYVRDDRGDCRLHFTVSPEHLESFRERERVASAAHGPRLGARFEVEYSVQKPSTDTLAVDPGNRPFRTERGRLLFRPGGHGALIENLNELRGDLVFVKNIDNVQPDELKPLVAWWKRIIGGRLIRLQDDVFSLVRGLRRRDPEDVRAAEKYARDALGMSPPDEKAGTAAAARGLLRILNRPLRVCGVVRNTGEPGGGPFWVRGQDRELSRQIVETSQIDPASDEQQRILEAATHFNPVDLACAVRDADGEPFDLTRFVDPNAVIVSRKSYGGRELKALERPGLWNGGMGGWITVFVEVPLDTFSPVKTVFDLLRKEHAGA